MNYFFYAIEQNKTHKKTPPPIFHAARPINLNTAWLFQNHWFFQAIILKYKLILSWFPWAASQDSCPGISLLRSCCAASAHVKDHPAPRGTGELTVHISMRLETDVTWLNMRGYTSLYSFANPSSLRRPVASVTRQETTGGINGSHAQQNGHLSRQIIIIRPDKIRWSPSLAWTSPLPVWLDRVEDRHTLLFRRVCTTCHHGLTREEQGNPVLVLQMQAEWQEVSAETKVSWPTSTILHCIHPHHCFSCIELTHKTVLRGLCIYSHDTPENVDSMGKKWMHFKTVVVGGQSCDD